MPVIHNVKDWAPFSIDAVGLITLLGANSLQKCLGRLVKHPWGECLPLMAGHIIPDDLILEPTPGFILYNVTDGIKVEGINAWFSRWLLSQDLSTMSTILHVEEVPKGRATLVQDFVSGGLGILIHAFIIIFSALIEDWYGLVAGITLALSTLTRVLVLGLCRKSLDSLFKPDSPFKMGKKPVKVVLHLPNSRTLTVHTTDGIVIKCIVGEIRPPNEKQYQILRIVGWAAFGIFIVALGMACLTVQLISAVVMILSTIVIVKKIGCSDKHVGSHLYIEKHNLDGQGSHKRTYAALQLTSDEEDAMVEWNLFPLRSNKKWWEEYYTFSQEYMASPTITRMLNPNIHSKLESHEHSA